MQRALMLYRAGQCGIDTAKTIDKDVEAAASMDRPANYSHIDLGESILYYVATLQLHRLPYDYNSSASMDPPTIYPVCNATLCDPLHPNHLHTRVFTWQLHMGRCGGDGKCTQAHDVVKLATNAWYSVTRTREALRFPQARSSSNQDSCGAMIPARGTCISWPEATMLIMQQWTS
jgi:hypothetical protein